MRMKTERRRKVPGPLRENIGQNAREPISDEAYNVFPKCERIVLT
jgi:hypothetical protein